MIPAPAAVVNPLDGERAANGGPFAYYPKLGFYCGTLNLGGVYAPDYRPDSPARQPP